MASRRLRGPDVVPFHAAFGRLRLSDSRSPRGTLDREQLLEGAWRTLVRAAGTWDEMPWHIAGAYAMAGRDAQHAFWGQGAIEQLSMLHQIATRLRAG